MAPSAVRTRSGATLVLGLALATVALLLLPAPSRTKAADGWGYWWGRVHAECVTFTTSSEEERVYAHVSTTMSVHNRGHFKHWVTNFRLKVRLVATTEGLDINNNWRTKRWPVHGELNQDYDYDHFPMVENTWAQDAESEWDLQARLIWDRRAPLADIVHEVEVPFDTSKCKRGAKPKSPSEAPSLG
ncbi:MAG TPA: hypothetical protein VMT37_09790 [Solirubrobacterales bacterium]|nr:hypothetical protein [Solirubrobacterales bacterium]